MATLYASFCFHQTRLNCSICSDSFLDSHLCPSGPAGMQGLEEQCAAIKVRTGMSMLDLETCHAGSELCMKEADGTAAHKHPCLERPQLAAYEPGHAPKPPVFQNA